MVGRADEPLPDAADAVIVGGGVVGVAAARDLAPDYDVVVVEKGAVAGEASALAAGEVTLATTYIGEREGIAEYGTSFFRDYSGTGDFHYEERNGVELVPQGRGGEAREYAAGLRDTGANVEYIDPPTGRERYPRIDFDRFDGGIEFRDTGFLDPYTFATTLADDAEDRGATICTERAVTGLVVENGTVTGVETEGGRIDADHVVAAAGWRTTSFLAEHLEIPVQPYRTQCIVLEPDDPVGEDFPMGWLPGEHVYFRPELNGDVLVGGFSFAEDDPERASGQADEAFRQHVAELLPRFVEGGDRARFVNGWAGVDGATPDTLPIIDAPDAAPDGLVVAAGFHGRGVMTAPIAAAIVNALVRDTTPPFTRDPFRLDRFEDTSPDFEFTSISAGDDDYD
ncbi:NAD(P)/FAD-dependent oxidoreductase [Halocalculus aciditolerans]|uniref:Oxidoreductase n=1 Tax=Halocalculus aciditolerans TaxID=1383812 RepID=A0A830FKY8_9EURY|nr:FAD-dependent oxidoreductase [Halocalculus aciditolerans]GGL66115.1 oxidoreductase [Halocalculus aciditolerans]